MAETQHTPGTWIAAPYSSKVGAPIVAASGRPVARVTYFAPNHESLKCHDRQSDANGALIAAAPDLLAALKKLLSVDGSHISELHSAAQEAHAAIAKAEGRS